MKKIKLIILNKTISSNFIPSKLRMKIVNLCGIKLNHSVIKKNTFFKNSKVVFGNNCFVNYDCKFYCSEDNVENGYIKLGNNVTVAMGVTFCTVSHEIGSKNSRAGSHTDKDIVIKDGVWIGANSTIMQGVTIGEGVVIGANSLVITDCEPNSIYVGIPAKKIKCLS